MLLLVRVGVWREDEAEPVQGGRNVSAIALQQVIALCSKQMDNLQLQRLTGRDIHCGVPVRGTMAMPVPANSACSGWRRSLVTCELQTAKGLHSHVPLHAQLAWTAC